MLLENILSAEQLGADGAEEREATHVFAHVSGKLFLLGELPAALLAGQHLGAPVTLEVIGQVLFQRKLLSAVAARVQHGAVAASEVRLQFIFAAKCNLAHRTCLAPGLLHRCWLICCNIRGREGGTGRGRGGGTGQVSSRLVLLGEMLLEDCV